MLTHLVKSLRLTKKETFLFSSVLSLIVLSILGPTKNQASNYHHFSDSRSLGFIPNAADVLTNLFFLFFGIYGLYKIYFILKAQKENNFQSKDLNFIHLLMVQLFYWGLTLTTFASGYYHWAPDDFGLVVDRLGMSVAFAGLLGVGLSLHITLRFSILFSCLFLIYGILSDLYWFLSFNLWPWMLLQVYGMLFFLTLGLFLKFSEQNIKKSPLQIQWLAIVTLYFIAKIFEAQDQKIFELTGYTISGHSLKHIIASFSALPVLIAVNKKI